MPSTIARAADKPSPTPPVFLLREPSSRWHGYEHLFMALHSNARPAIEHAHRHLFIVATQFNGRLAGVFDGVVQQGW